jgi:hypothetical protein
MGRRRDGTWLDGSPASAEPDFAADPHGRVTPLDSHVRRAHPRTDGSSGPPLIRRSWGYTEHQTGGGPDDGLLFMCYQADLDAGFVAVQKRLVGQAMDRYLLTVSGGYFVVPPPDAPGRRWRTAFSRRDHSCVGSRQALTAVRSSPRERDDCVDDLPTVEQRGVVVVGAVDLDQLPQRRRRRGHRAALLRRHDAVTVAEDDRRRSPYGRDVLRHTEPVA